MSAPESFRVAAVQASPVWFDRAATLAKAVELIAEAGREGASLVVFPEAFVSGYPFWVWFVPPGQTRPLRDFYTALHRGAVDVPGPVLDGVAAAAREAGVAVVLPVNERNSEAGGTTLFNSYLIFGPDGTLVAKHRKLMPTGGERIVWGQGDGADLDVVELPFARVGGLLCWENYMPLARYWLYSRGLEVLAAPTWDRGEPWTSTMRHVGKEGRCFVVACCMPMRRSEIPEPMASMPEFFERAGDWINPGGSLIVDPDGKLVAGPLLEQEGILYADVRREQLVGPRWQLDACGHYGRSDVFELRIHRRPSRVATVVAAADEAELDAANESGA